MKQVTEETNAKPMEDINRYNLAQALQVLSFVHFSWKTKLPYDLWSRFFKIHINHPTMHRNHVAMVNQSLQGIKH